VGAFASILDPEHCLPSLDAALDLLIGAVGADSAELFLLDPKAGELLLVCQRGDDSDVFAERCRFTVGVGFPGQAVASGSPRSTTDLQHEETFLRDAVKARGFRTFISVPFGITGQCLGTLDLAWRRHDIDTAWVEGLIAKLGRPIASSLLASTVIEARELEQSNGEIQQRFLAASRADEAVLVRIGADAAEGTDGPWDATRVDCAMVRGEGRLVLHNDPTRMPGSCMSSCGVAETRYCVPLFRDGEIEGVARLSYESHPPFPATRHALAALSLATSRGHAPSAPVISAVQVEPPTPALELRCFGAFDILVDGEPLPRSAFSRKKAVELLQLLTLQTGRALPTRRLTRLLWPGVDPDAGRNRLHGVVHALRNAIEPKQPDGPARTYIQSSDDHYCLDAVTAVRVDLWEFRRLMATARTAWLAGDRSSGVADALRRAVDIYRGELFAGLPDALWTVDPRSRCREQCVDAVLHLAEIHDELRRPDEVIGLLRQAVGVDPLREDVHLRLIRALFTDGRRRDALVQYDALCAALDEELDAAPSSEARKLLAQIRAS